MEFFLIWVILAILVGAWASGRGHSGLGMFLLALILSPLIAALIEAIRGRNDAALEQKAVAGGSMRKCPACAELVRAEASKCRYCGEALAAEKPAARQCRNCGTVYTASAAQNCGRCGEALGTGGVRQEIS